MEILPLNFTLQRQIYLFLKIMIQRQISGRVQGKLGKGKAIVLLGARQVGKSTMLKQLFQDRKDVLWLDAEDFDIRTLFEKPTSTRLKKIYGGKKIVIIDEAQKIDQIGSVLKLSTDYLKTTQLIATGSSSFELRNKTNEPLTGRKWEYHLFPFSFSEMVNHSSLLEEKRLLTHRLIYGYYPEVVIHDDEQELRLKLLSESYLYKDLLLLPDIKKPDMLLLLLKALALQVGSEVNYHELGKRIGLKNETIEKYIDLLEKAFVLFRVPAYSGNHRKELKKGKKIYFYDNGIRNAIIGDFKVWENRQDKGALFENFIISELYKKYNYRGKTFQFYFWRSFDQQEIDLIVEEGNEISVFEIKWNPASKVRLSKTFTSAYGEQTLHFIHRDNVDDYLLDG